jgi:thioredoxin reductase (NADPH)
MKSFFLLFIFLFISVFAVDAKPLEKEAVIVLGSGMGSLSSALYLARAGIIPLVIEGPSPGGLITQSNSVQNWPGEMEISGADLAAKVTRQVIANGAKLLLEEVVAVDFSKRPYLITTRGIGEEETKQRLAQCVIVALGSKPNFLAIPGEDTYWGRGISNCAVCDGALYRGRKVAVVGGGDAAVLEALYLSHIAKEVFLFVRKGAFKGIEEKRIQTLEAKANVKIFFNTQVQEVKGTKDNLTTLVLKSGDKPKYEQPIDGLFLAIGSQPNSQLFKGALELDAQGYIILKNGQETSVPGVYAMGDIVDPMYKQAITAAGDGAKAALQVERELSN